MSFRLSTLQHWPTSFRNHELFCLMDSILMEEAISLAASVCPPSDSSYVIMAYFVLFVMLTEWEASVRLCNCRVTPYNCFSHQISSRCYTVKSQFLYDNEIFDCFGCGWCMGTSLRGFVVLCFIAACSRNSRRKNDGLSWVLVSWYFL